MDNREISDVMLEEVAKAAKEGARQGAKEAQSEGAAYKKAKASVGFSLWGLVKTVVLLAVLGACFYFFRLQYTSLENIKAQLTFDSKADTHDLVLEDNSILGYTAADFAEAILGDNEKQKKLIVMETDVSDAATLTNTGIMNVKLMSKTQLITYHGYAAYGIDLSKLSKNNVSLDDSNKSVTVRIPHAQLDSINIPSEEIEFGNVEKGLLAFGGISGTPEQLAQVETMAKEKMQKKLEENCTNEAADRFAKLAVWELYQPVINGVAKGYSLIIEFDGE